MGCGNSKIDIVNHMNGEEITDKEGARFNSFLATLPPLFTEAFVDKHAFLCTAHVPSDFRSMVFACVDNDANYYEKFVLEDELIETVCFWLPLSLLSHLLTYCCDIRGTD